MFLLAFSPQDKIEVRNLKQNFGLLPLKLGNAKIQHYTHTLIHFSDLNPFINQIRELDWKSDELENLLNLNTDYKQDVSNYLKILKVTKLKVHDKLDEILPNNRRTKRGLINGLGSIFKSISGNLDASDGERYDQLIENLQKNQGKLELSIKNQNSISFGVIEKFGKMVEQIKHNEDLLNSKLKQISNIVSKSGYRENSIYIKDIANQIINLYEIINSVLQDIENSITFAKLRIMHPSIIRTVDLYEELLKLQKYLRPEQFYLDITLENIPLFENFIKIDSYILNNKITYLLKIPISFPTYFEYYHLFSCPTFSEGHFKAVFPRQKFLIKDKLHYTFSNDACLQIKTDYYGCEKLDIKEFGQILPCEVQLVSGKNTTNCEETWIQITEPIFKQLGETSQYIGLLPSPTIIKLSCGNQEESLDLHGSYLFDVPTDCFISLNNLIIINERRSEINEKPIFFPTIPTNWTPEMPTANMDFELENFQLDELQNLKLQLLNNNPDVSFMEFNRIPSVWTIIIYGIIIFLVVYAIYKKCIRQRCFKTSTRNSTHQDTQERKIHLTEVLPADVQLLGNH